MRSLTWDEVRARQVARSHLDERVPAERLADVVRDVCGVHAQLLSAAELSIAARVAGLTREDVRSALWERRTLVKSWTVRGTLHLHPADELPLWTAVNRLDPYWRDPAWLESFGMSSDEAEAILEAIGDALDGRCLTREQLGDEVERRVGSWAKRTTEVVQFGKLASTWIQLLGVAATTGRLCFGPPRGAKVTFVRADQWIGGWEELDPDEALAEVLRRYLSAYGPATHQDFAHWCRVKPARARDLVGSLAGELEQVDVDGRGAWLPAADAEIPPAARAVRLLPQYDCYVIGSAPPGDARRDLVPEVAGKRVFDRGGGPFAVLLVDGRAAGVWDRRGRGKRLELEVAPFGRLTAARRRQLDAERARIGEFLGLDATLSVA